MAVEREVIVEVPATFAGMKISWGGVFGGVLAGIGTLMLLSSLGLAIGISTVDLQETSAASIGTEAAVWTALTLLVALFVGGWASTRLSMLWERTTALFEGVLVWVMSMTLILYLAANGIGLVSGGAFGLIGPAAQAAGVSLDTHSVAAANASVTAWLSFVALLLSLLAAIGGAFVGRRSVVQRVKQS